MKYLQKLFQHSKKNSMKKENVKKAIIYLISSIATALTIAFGMTSCSFVRNVTTSAEHISKGDTSIIIQTKTVESYTATKQN